MPNSWLPRFPDLTGKTAIVGADDAQILHEVVRVLAANGVHVALVAADRQAIAAAAATAEQLGAEIYAVTGDPGDPALWVRVVPHVEQRLGPIDIAIAVGSPEQRRALLDSVCLDMAARGRGVTVAAGGPAAEEPGGPRRRLITGDPAADIAATVALCCSDTLPAADVVVQLG